MSEIIRFQDHARTSAGSRAAKAVNVSALKPADAARSVASTDDHHSAGILFLCPHLVTRGTVVPTSDAIASREGQSSIIARNDVICVIPPLIGQSVLKRKAILSLDGKLSLGHTVRMAETESEAQYKLEFRARVKESRVAAKLKQWQIAEALGMTQDKYKQYESRSLLPHHLIGRFCVICRVNPEWLITGHGPRAIQPLKTVAGEPEPVARPKPTRKPQGRLAAG
jgi:DNA-binding transcriptional regulator YiaG